MITDTDARRLSSQWHGGGGTALYALCSTGAIDTARPDHDTIHEITENIQFIGRHWAREGYQRDYTQADRNELEDLLAYVKHHGTRGPVDEWSRLTF